MSRIFKRLSSSTTTFTAKSTPSKDHLHAKIPSSSFPKGYLVNGSYAGVKKSASALDLALILSNSARPTSSAAVFTANAFRAAPVLVSQDVLERSAGRARALVVNSGCANAVTGKQGLDDAWAMVKATDGLLEPAPSDTSETLVMSTGVIGQTLPISSIISSIKSQKKSELGGSFAHWEKAARAFMTTDTFPKLRARTFQLAGREFRIAGISKGAGMIHPHLVPPSAPPHATLLAAFATDAPIKPRTLQSVLGHAAQRSFNAISVDGDMSTNDCVVLFANGAGAEETEIRELDEDSDVEAVQTFKEELTSFMQEMAQLVVRDGEGATKFVTVSVEVS